MGTPRSYENSVFINCPFDAEYRPIFEALVFAVFDCGFVPRCAYEFAGSGGARIENLVTLVRECKYGIHDISRTELSSKSKLPRFNMPLELGMFLGAMKLGTASQRRKECLIFDRAPYRYQKFISDIAGQDIQPHYGSFRTAIKRVRDWLNAVSDPSIVKPGGAVMVRRYEKYLLDLPAQCAAVHLEPDELTFSDIVFLISGWLQENPIKVR